MLLFQDGGNIVGIFRDFLFEAEAVSIEQIAVLVVFGEKKCNFKSMSRFAVVEFEDIEVTLLSWVQMNYQDFLENLFFLL